MLKFRFDVLAPLEGTRLSFAKLDVNDQEYPDNLELTFGETTDIASTLPTRYAVRSWPNPFNPKTRIHYTVPTGVGLAAVDLRIYDIAGRLVRSLERSNRPAGSYYVDWDGADNGGTISSAGIYLLRIRAGEWSATEKLILVK